jgi:DNA polymerase V
VAVLSNNDGNIVARNYLAKKAGLKMGDPYFKVRPIIERHNIAIFSSNYTLYASMSARFAAVVESLQATSNSIQSTSFLLTAKG